MNINMTGRNAGKSFIRTVFASICMIGVLAGCSKAAEPNKVPVPEPGKKPIVVHKDTKQAVKVVGDKLYIGAKYNSEYDILITFSQCMFNKLMTFSQVGLASNKSKYPLPDPDREVEVMLNQAFSDNIGPFCITNNGWCGANHSYKDKNEVNTAENISFSFYADGKKLKDKDKLTAKRVQIKVENRIFNPMVQPAPGAKILSEELCKEEVEYLVENGSIYVNAKHTFTNASPVPIYVYYGMQSMFWNESQIMTPQGEYADFMDASPDKTFYKGEYPDFRRYIERRMEPSMGQRGKMLYQSAYLLPEGNGKHDQLKDNQMIFTHSWGKCYHVILKDVEAHAGMKVNWSGIYNWFDPIIDNDQLLVYTARAKGKDYLFIDARKAVKDMKVGIPDQLRGKKHDIASKSKGVTRLDISEDGKYLTLSTTGPESAILIF